MPGQSFARQLQTLKVTVTKSTAQASPQVNTWSLGNVLIYSLSVRVPAGHADLTGISVLYQGLSIFPFGQPVTYLTTNDETLSQLFNDEEVGAPLTVQTFNTDVFDHSFYLRADTSLFLPSSLGAESAPLVPIA